MLPYTRFRQLDSSSPQYSNVLNGTRYYNGVPTAITATQTCAGDVSSKNMWDVENVDFHKRRAAGEIFNNPVDSDEVTETFIVGDYKRTLLTGNSGDVWNGKWSAETYCPAYLEPPSEDWDEFRQDLIDRAVTMAYANRSAVQMAVSMTLAEGRKTIQGCYEILFRVVQIAKAAKRLDFRYLLSEISFKELTDRYMEFRYGIRPLMIDMNNVVEAYNTKLGVARHTARGGASDRIVISDVVNNGNTSFNLTWSRTTSYDCQVRSGILCNVTATPLNVWGIDQVAETVLEVIPFSFILGWFYNIADLLSSWTPKAGVTELASWYTATTNVTQNVTMTSCSNVPANYTQESLEWSYQRFKNAKYTIRVPNPERTVWPQLNVNLDSLKIIDLGIILGNLLSGKTSKFLR